MTRPSALNTRAPQPVRARSRHVVALMALASASTPFAVHAQDGLPSGPPASAADDLRSTSRLSLGALIDLNDGKAVLATGQTAPDGTANPLSLGAAASLGYARSYVIAAADAGRSMASAQHGVAIGGLLPQVSGRFAIGVERSAPASIVDTETGKVVPVDTHERRDLIVTVSQPILDWSALAALSRTRHARDAAGAAAQDARDEEGLRIAQAYFGLVQACLGHKLLEDYSARLAGLQRWMSGRVAGGGASVADGQQVEGRVLAVKSLLEQQKAARDQAAISFEQLTGKRPDQLLIPGDLANGAPASLEEALARADRSNPGLAELAANERAARAEHSSALGGFLPRLSVEASQVGAMNAGGDPGWRRDKRVMAVATWTLSPLSTVQTVRAAAAKSRQIHYQRLDQQRTVEQALRVVFSALDTVKVRIDTARKELAANRDVVESFDVQFSAGRKSLLELLDAYERLYQARQAMLIAGLSGAQLYFQTLRVMGDLSPALARDDEGAR